MTPPPAAEAARALGIEVAQPESVNADGVRAHIASVQPEAVLICAFGGLIREPLLSAYEMLNVHPSLLPRWRGPAPIERAIEAGDRETGVSIMRPVAEMDAGPVCLARAEPIHPDDDFGTLSARLQKLGGDLLVEALDVRAPCREQPGEGVTLAEKVTADDRRLDPESGAAELERRVRALSPHVGAYLELEGGERLQVLRARALGPREDVTTGEGGPREEGPAQGELRSAAGRLLLGCSSGALEILRVKPAGGRAMDAAAYARGRARGFALPPRHAPQSEGR